MGLFLRQFCLFKALLTLPIKGRKKNTQKKKHKKNPPYQIFVSLLKLPEICSCFQWKRNCDSKTYDIHTVPGPAPAQGQAHSTFLAQGGHSSLAEKWKDAHCCPPKMCSKTEDLPFEKNIWFPAIIYIPRLKLYLSTFSKASCDYTSSPNPTSSVSFTSEQMWESIQVGET